MNEIAYKITFGDHREYVTNEGLLNFIKIAVIHNKDISDFHVERVL